LAGRTAVVTGGGAGIGRGVALRLAAARARVMVADVDDRAGAATVESARAAGGTASFVHADVLDDDAAAAMLAAAEETFGALHIVVNNAGGVEPPFYPDAPVEHWSRVVDLNLRAVMCVTQLALARMGGRPGGGAIVNIAS